MAKFNPYLLSAKERKRIVGQFFNALSLLDNDIDIKNFFEDLLTESEMIMLARRLEVARMLVKGVGYQKIRSALKVGFDNINAVNCWLRYGKKGYASIIEKLDKFEKKNLSKKSLKKEKTTSFDWYDVKRKFPANFWPKELLKKLDIEVEDYLGKNVKKSRKDVTKIKPS